jgi:hypothetical protein
LIWAKNFSRRSLKPKNGMMEKLKSVSTRKYLHICEFVCSLKPSTNSSNFQETCSNSRDIKKALLHGSESVPRDQLGHKLFEI